MKNALLGILGGIFVAAGLSLFLWMVASSWGYAGPLEWAIGFLLLLWCAGFGVALLAATHPCVMSALVRAWRRIASGSRSEPSREGASERAARLARQR